VSGSVTTGCCITRVELGAGAYWAVPTDLSFPEGIGEVHGFTALYTGAVEFISGPGGARAGPFASIGRAGVWGSGDRTREHGRALARAYELGLSLVPSWEPREFWLGRLAVGWRPE